MIYHIRNYFFVILCALILIDVATPGSNVTYPEPEIEGIHLSSGVDPSTQIVIMWTARYTQYESLKAMIVSVESQDTDNITFHHSNQIALPDQYMYIHRAEVKDLTPNTTYRYRIAGTNGSGLFHTWRFRQDQTWSPELLFYGSLHTAHTKYAHVNVTREIKSGRYDAVFSLGNIGCKQPDSIVYQNLQSVASFVPLFTTPGELDAQDGYYYYDRLYSMPGVKWPMDRHWYSFDLGHAHIISFSTESILLTNATTTVAKDQTSWLKQDLIKANHPNNRNTNRPWIIAFGNSPMYCSGSMECLVHSKVIRKNLEDLFYEYGVDLVISAQDHMYERTFPVHRGRVSRGHYQHPHTPVYVSTAAFTCNDKATRKDQNHEQWSAVTIILDGTPTYGRLRIQNWTHLYFEEISAKDNNVLDRLVLHQRYHGPFGVRNRLHPGLVVLFVVLAVLFCLMLVVLYIWRRKRRKADANAGKEESGPSYITLHNNAFDL